MEATDPMPRSSCRNCADRNGKDERFVKQPSRNRADYSIRCTKLHDLCFHGASIDAVRALTLRCPLSTRSVDRFGRSALFWAIKLGRPDAIIRHIYHAAPELLCSPDVYGKTALDLLFAPRTKNAQILRWLLEQDPCLILSPSPFPCAIPLLHRICVRWSLLPHSGPVDQEIALTTIDAAHRFLCCRCNATLTTDGSCMRPLLYMAMDLGLPCVVLQKIANTFPVDMRAFRALPTQSPLHMFLSRYSPDDDSHAVLFLLQLLDLNPRAAQEPIVAGNGPSVLPLHLAIQRGFAWKDLHAIERLVQAAPWVLHKADPPTGLLSFQIAAVAECCGKDTAQLDAIFTLLRAQPSVIRQ